MISDIKVPKNRYELLRALQKQEKLDFEVMEIGSRLEKDRLVRKISALSKNRRFTAILIKDEM